MSNPEPITDAHKAFGKELVELARKHHVYSFSIELRGGGYLPVGERGTAFLAADSTSLKISWFQERHGTKGKMVFRSEASCEVREE